ncbi:hypothetical protein [Tenacibaculum sp. C7A-26P2]|uniref:hypothetical protein n=1 Tax=Tenacibaculum sp. C7A-26P2 TaxID=3447504 RepID=UPI003F831E2A
MHCILFSQKFTLQVTSNIQPDLNIINTYSYKKRHSTKENVFSEVKKIKKSLNKKGYLKVTYKLSKQDSTFTYYFQLGKKINVAKIKRDNAYIQIKFCQLKKYLEHKKKELDSKGESFTEIKLTDINITQDTLNATLITHRKNVRSINKVVVKGYQQFPKSYFKNYLFLKKKKVVNKRKLNLISEQLQTLNFVREVKKPEFLFSNDSTFLFLYLSKKKQSSFDGFLSAIPSKNKLKVSGNLILKLLNTMDKGEDFVINWISNQNNTSLNINLNYPFMFNTPITPKINFNIFKQDSTFITSKVYSELSYQSSYKSSYSFCYSSTKSSYLLNQNSKNISSFSSHFLGVSFETLLKPKKSIFTNNSYFKSSLFFGSRNSANQKDYQMKLLSKLKYTHDFSKKKSVSVGLEAGFLISDSYVENELFRIGGSNSIHGFLLNSIEASKYGIVNTQYNHLINKNKLLYTIFDTATYKHNRKNTIFSMGIGYSQFLNNTLTSIEYVLGSNKNQKFFNGNSLLSIRTTIYL